MPFDFGGSSGSSEVISLFTPELFFGGDDTGITYTAQNGRVLQLGRLVYFTIELAVLSTGAAVGNASIVLTDLPEAEGNSSVDPELYACSFWGDGFAAGVTQPIMIQLFGGPPPELQLSRLIAGNASSLTQTEIVAGTSLTISGTYIAAST